MYTTKLISQILEEGLDKYKDYKLCFIDDIEQTYSDWDEESQALINSPDFSWEEEHKKYGCGNSPRLHLKDYPNPDYIEGKQEKYAFFTPISLEKQWGDDWDDYEYTSNAGWPYDDYWEDDKPKVDIEIIRIPFYFDYHCRLPHQSYTAEEIRNKAAAWLYFSNKDDHDVLFAGDSIEKFIKTYFIWNHDDERDL